tara:strand:- start:17869 stop:18699 length:831 start_codon:yes stop_codon:yes gene_type:complete
MGSIMGLFKKNKMYDDKGNPILLSDKLRADMEAATDETHLQKGYKEPYEKPGTAISRMFVDYDDPKARLIEQSKRINDWWGKPDNRTMDVDVDLNLLSQEKRSQGKVYKDGELVDQEEGQTFKTGRQLQVEDYYKNYVYKGFKTDKERAKIQKRIEKGTRTGNTNLKTPLGKVVTLPYEIAKETVGGVATAAVGMTSAAAKLAAKGLADGEEAESFQPDTTLPELARRAYISNVQHPSVTIPQAPQVSLSSPQSSSPIVNNIGPGLQNLTKFLGIS